MDKKIYDYIVDVLKKELVPASGCTEPIAISYASATARHYLGEMPEKMEVQCSANVIKNVKGVTVPNTGGLKGVCTAAIVGAVGGDYTKELEVLANVTKEQIKEVNDIYKTNCDTNYCKVELLNSEEKLYIIVKAISKNHYCEVTIFGAHTNIVKIIKDGNVICENDSVNLKTSSEGYNKEYFKLDNLLDFIEELDINDIKDILDNQIECNINCANEGIKNNYGITIGQTLKEESKNTFDLAIAFAAAASEARMGGCNLPIVTNSGSGNQGITVSIPVIIYAGENNINKDMLYRALTLSNLISIRIKIGIGRMSAFCGAVSAACGTGTAITYMNNGSREQIRYTIQNMLGNVSGIVCDGAKTSCALKISSALNGAFTAHRLAMKNKVLEKDTGLIKEDVEETIDQIGVLGFEGMRETDIVILNMMTKSGC